MKNFETVQEVHCGIYYRQTFAKKGSAIVGKLHKKGGFSFLLKGKILQRDILEDGTFDEYLIEAPSVFKTYPNSRRCCIVLEDTIYATTTVTNNKKLDIIKLDKEMYKKEVVK